MNIQTTSRRREPAHEYEYILDTEQPLMVRGPDFSPGRLLRSTAKWGTIACASWAIISGGMYLGYVVVHTIVFGPDIW